jgi:hypothetical protein
MHLYGQPVFDKGAKTQQGTTSLINDIGETECPHTEE